MNLFKRITIQVDGFEGEESETSSFFISDLTTIKDDDVISQDDVVDQDAVFLTYERYENLGEITEDEIKILSKFTIIK